MFYMRNSILLQPSCLVQCCLETCPLYSLMKVTKVMKSKELAKRFSLPVFIHMKLLIKWNNPCVLNLIGKIFAIFATLTFSSGIDRIFWMIPWMSENVWCIPIFNQEELDEIVWVISIHSLISDLCYCLNHNHTRLVHWPEEKCSPTEPGFSQGFSLFCLPMECVLLPLSLWFA